MRDDPTETDSPNTFDERQAFDRLIATPPEEQARVLDEIGPDEAQRRRLVRLLEAHERSKKANTLESAQTLSASGLEEIEEVGPYRVIEVIGSGGMGVVYRAEQREPIRRTVALKVIRAEMGGTEAVARFHSERQALALMNHENIARIFDSGTTAEGRPYFAMEYVEGMAITEFCDDQRYSVDARIELFLEVCRAVQHAHQKGVVHRDLKPSNVLVTATDDVVRAKVIDFGIAKAMETPLIEDAAATRVGGFLGSPEYSSPEQAGVGPGDIDSRADIFALGAVLYELLTGYRPLDLRSSEPSSLAEIQRQIREVDPPRPSRRVAIESGADEQARARATDRKSLIRRLRGDLDWIVGRAMEKDRDLRYPSATALSEDLQRHLQDEPVAASPPSLAYRARKFGRRNRVPVAIASVLIIGLIATTVASMIGLRRAQEAAQTADRSADFLIETVAQIEVEDFARSLRALLSADLERATDSATLSADGPFHETVDSWLSAVDMVAMSRELIDGELLSPAAERLAATAEEEPLLAAYLERALGWTYLNVGLLDQAEPRIRRSVTLFEQELGPRHPETLEASARLGSVLRSRSEFHQALELQRHNLEARRKVLGSMHSDTLDTQNEVAKLLYYLGRYSEAEGLQRETYAARIEVDGPSHRRTLDSLHHLALIARRQGRLEEAAALHRQALDLQLETLGSSDLDSVRTMGNLANVLGDLGRIDESMDLRRRALDVQRLRLGEDHPDTLSSYNNLAETHRRYGSIEEAERIFVELFDPQRRVLGSRHLDHLQTSINLALLYGDTDRPEEAEAIWQRVIPALEATLGGQHDRTSSAKNGYAWLLLTRLPVETRRPGEALQLAREATQGSGAGNLLRLDTLSLALFESGMIEEAIENQQIALALAENHPEPVQQELRERLERYEKALDRNKR